jgi:hypothetical protein
MSTPSDTGAVAGGPSNAPSASSVSSPTTGRGRHREMVVTPSLARQQLADRYWPYIMQQLSLLSHVSLSNTATKDLHRLLQGYLLVVHASIQVAADPKGDRGAKKGYCDIHTISLMTFDHT